MFGDKQNYFKNGRIDQAALVSFIKDIKKNTSLSDEDAATLAASKVNLSSSTHIKSHDWFHTRSHQGGSVISKAILKVMSDIIHQDLNLNENVFSGCGQPAKV